MFRKWQISLAIVLMVLGIMASFQFRTQQTLLKDYKEQKTEDLLDMAASLNSKNLDLIRQQSDLKAQLDSLKNLSKGGQTLQDSMSKDMTNMAIALGTQPVKGSGIDIQFPDNINVRPEDVPSIVNDLWNAGAEAIAVNGIRITNNTYFGSENNDDQVATINGKVLEVPLEIKAIGPPDYLSRSVSMRGRTLDDYAKWGDPADIKQVENIILPAADNATQNK